MNITVLGTRGEIKASAPYHSKRSGVLLNNELLLDIGEQSFLNYKPKAILITHLHPDHAYFVREKETPAVNVPIYAPEVYKDVEIQVVKESFTTHGYDITPIPTIHSIKVASHAYLIKHENKRILYTGDMIWIEKKYHPLLQNLDLVITEASFIRKGGMIRKNFEGNLYGHTGIPDLVHLFKKYTHTILFVHFGTWFYDNVQAARKKLKELAHEHDIKIIVGYDGLEIEV